MTPRIQAVSRTHKTSELARYTVHFTGRVQGVGFRYTTVEIAQRHDVAGYVQNLSDGRVRLVVEGESAEVERFVEAVNDAMSRHVDDRAIEVGRASGEFGSPTAPDTFGVRY